ncbi:Uncharacterized protein pbN1_14070 [Aromatoleum bremense]|nr:Uncharacterized protein pbN1_14070 [Aromatoleum bremense]
MGPVAVVAAEPVFALPSGKPLKSAKRSGCASAAPSPQKTYKPV